MPVTTAQYAIGWSAVRLSGGQAHIVTGVDVWWCVDSAHAEGSIRQSVGEKYPPADGWVITAKAILALIEEANADD